jgi:hypothetical protein
MLVLGYKNLVRNGGRGEGGHWSIMSVWVASCVSRWERLVMNSDMPASMEEEEEEQEGCLEYVLLEMDDMI